MAEIICLSNQRIADEVVQSGDPEPSEDDLTITKRLVEAGKILGIEVLDHIVIAKSNYFSFKDRGLLR